MVVKMEDFGFKKEEVAEIARMSPPQPTGWPKPTKRMRVCLETFNLPIEVHYFWILNHLGDVGATHFDKITDIFAASEQSSFWGAAQQRLQIQQQNVSNYLQTIAKLMQSLFQIIRELRHLDERLELYDESFKYAKEKTKKSLSAEIVLKGYWVDLKEGGTKNPSSVTGMATQLGFAILPDLFFGAPPMKHQDVDRYVDGLEFNEKVLRILKRKLKAYCIWKEHTYQEIKSRRNFVLKFLRQHYNTIHLYMSWVKPYLKNTQRLRMDLSKQTSEHLIGAFEGSVVEIELIARKKEGRVWGCVDAHFLFRTRPALEFHQDAYAHKGPIHVGRTMITLRTYAWTDEELDNYRSFKEAQMFEDIGSFDETLKSSMEQLGDELKGYLKEAGEEFPEDKLKEEIGKKKKKPRPPGIEEPFVSLFYGLKELIGPLVPIKTKTKEERGKAKLEFVIEKDRKKALVWAEKVGLWLTYKNFKKQNRMFEWG